MTPSIVRALALEPLTHPPVWVMRQAGRHLPEYREIRARHSFQEVVATPELAAEVTLQPVQRYGMDGAVIFADIMTPVEAMGVEMDYDPGPRLNPLTLSDIVALPELDTEKVAHVAETIRLVRSQAAETTAVVGFAGAPVTLLAYLLEGGGSKDFMTMRAALRAEPDLARSALETLARSMRAYLQMQADAGADVVQLFDTWAGLLDRDTYRDFAIPSARASMADITAGTLYFSPGAGHVLDLQRQVDADGFGIDWRTPIEDAVAVFEAHAIQGNLDPAVLLTDPDAIKVRVHDLLAKVDGRPGHIVNLGHGIDRNTSPENVAALVEAVRS